MKPLILVALLAVLPVCGHAQGIESLVSLYEHGKYQSAADGFSRLTQKSPDNANLHLWAGKAFFKLHRWNEAVREFERAAALKPLDGLNHLWFARALGRKAESAFFTSAFGLARQACREFEAAVRLAPENLDARFDLLDYYSQAPGIVGGGREKAEAQAREIAKLSPRAGYSARAEIFAAGKEMDAALRELVQATVKFPNEPDGFLDLAESQHLRGDYPGALANARKALALDANNPRAILYTAAAEIELQRNLPEALMNLRVLAAGVMKDNDPSFEEVHYWVGRALLAQNQTAEARQAFQASLSFDPDYRRSKEALARIR